jgi:two-component system sensor histidine kinase PhoQ
MRRLTDSLSRRLLLAALILLPLALGTTAWFLERAHRDALNAATAERLQLQVLALLARADVAEDFDLPLRPLETRLLQPESGLYAIVTDVRGDPLWVSPSAALLPRGIERLSAGVPALAAGQRHDSERDGLLRHAYQVLWELDDGRTLPLRFLVAESTGPRDADVLAFRRSLGLWLLGTFLLLLLVQLGIFRWGLKPLRELAERVAHIEKGERADLSGDWPREVQPLVANLETLLSGEQQRRTRMRNTLADLAHSLKTPLAVLRSADVQALDFAALQGEQLDRMEEVVAWHLQRAVGGNHRLLQRVAVLPVLERLRATLQKVYAQRALQFAVDGDPQARFRGDERDLMEILGNLLDNACKYANTAVSVRVEGGYSAQALRIFIDDDGSGISPELRDSLLQRGARADTRTDGQGIGLAVVIEIVTAQGRQP